MNVLCAKRGFQGQILVTNLHNSVDGALLSESAALQREILCKMICVCLILEMCTTGWLQRIEGSRMLRNSKMILQRSLA